jgi:hypothetical protein
MGILETLGFMVLLESAIIGALLFLTYMGYPGWIKIALARVKGKQYVFSVTRDKALTIQGAREEEGIYKTSLGAYELEPEDSFTFNGSTGALWYAPYNTAVLLRVMPLLRDLKEWGLSTYGQLHYYYDTPIEEIQAKLGEEGAEKARILKAYDGKILQDLEVVRITDLKNFLESRSPSAENGIIERYISIERRKLGNPFKNSNVILFIVMAGLLGLCVGYIMAGGHAGDSTALHTVASASSNLQQIK